MRECRHQFLTRVKKRKGSESMRFAREKRAHDHHEMDIGRHGQWITPWMATISILIMITTQPPCAAYYCDFEKCHWKLDEATDSSVRLTYEHTDDRNNNNEYRPRGRIPFALIRDFLPGEVVYFVSPWFNSSASSCTMIYESESIGGTINVVIVTRFSNNSRSLESKTFTEDDHTGHMTVLGQMTEPFRVGFQITADQKDGPTLAAFYQVHLQNCSENDTSTSGSFCPLHEIPCNQDVCVPRDYRCDINKDCDATGDEQECGELPYCAHCTFEKDFCCWQNSNKDKGMRWVRHYGPTTTPQTGPQGDHTNGTGYYIYTHRVGSTPACAVLESVVFSPPPEETRNYNSPYINSCQVRFFYHFHGYHVVSMSLKLVNVCEPDQKPVTLWSTDEPPGGMDIWRKAVGTINVSYSYSLEISGICGIGEACDIAIDDISLSPECFGYGLLEFSTDSHTDKHQYTKNGTFFSNDTHICFIEHSGISVNTKFGGLSDVTSQNVFNVWLAVSVIISLSSIISGYVFWRRRQQTRLARRMCRLKSLHSPVSLLPHNRIGDRIGTEVNPTYDLGMMFPENTDMRHLPRSHVHLVRPIGQGAFGEVYQGYLSNIVRGYSEYPVAVKTLPALSTEQAGEDFVMEAIIMSKFNHPNIVKFLGVCFEAHPKFIVLELLNGGDLRNFLRENRPKLNIPATLTSSDLLGLSLDVAKGCQYLEMNRFIHRDIAARNCLLTCNNDQRKAKIADFGMARDIYRSDYYRKDGRALLPVKWMPPEAFIDGIFSTKTDIWSFGVLLWEIFSLGCSPYPGQGNQEVIQHVAYGARMGKPRGCSPVIYDVMLACWQSNADERPDFNHITEVLNKCSQDEEVLSHPLPDSYCPLIVEPPPAPLAPPYHGARKVRPPKFYVRSSHHKNHLNRDQRHNAGQTVKLSYASIGFMDCEDEEVDVIEEEEEEVREEEEEEEREEEEEEREEEEEEEEKEEEEEEEGNVMDNVEEVGQAEGEGDIKGNIKEKKKRTKKRSNNTGEKKKEKEDQLNNSIKNADDHECHFEIEDLDQYEESDELLEAFQTTLTQLTQLECGDIHQVARRPKFDNQSHYQNQRLSPSWKWCQRERELRRCQPVLETTEELDETFCPNEKDNLFEQEHCGFVYVDNEETDDEGDKTCGQRCLPEDVALLSTGGHPGLQSSSNEFIGVVRRQSSGSNWREDISVIQMTHATSLPSVHYQNCDNGNGVDKQKLRGVFSLT